MTASKARAARFVLGAKGPWVSRALIGVFGVLFLAGTASGSVSAFLDFDATSDLTDGFVLLYDGFSVLSPYGGDPGTIWSDGQKLCFDRNGPNSHWSGTEPNLYAFRGASGSPPIRLSEGVVSIDNYLNYNTWTRGMNLYAGFFLYDPDKAAGQLGAWDTPYVNARMYRWGKWDYDGIANRFFLHVAGGLTPSQDSGWTTTPLVGESWATHTLTFEPSASGGYDIDWSSSVSGVNKHTYTDHTNQDLSNVALGLYVNYFEFMDATRSIAQAGGLAYMDNFSLNYEPGTPTGGVVPEPSSLIVWGLLGMVGLGIFGWRRSRRAR